MDPNETLRLLREYAQQFEALEKDSESLRVVDYDDYIELAVNFYEKFTALDVWMSKGGFSPWETPKRAVAYRKVQD